MYTDQLHRLLFAGKPPGDPRTAARAWRRRQIMGKFRNIARLTKAAFTYRGGFTYALSKVERHSGRPVALSPWQRRWPVRACALAGPLPGAATCWRGAAGFCSWMPIGWTA